MKKEAAVEQNLSYIVANCVTQNTAMHPDQFACELVEGTEKTINFPNLSVDEVLRINIDR